MSQKLKTYDRGVKAEGVAALWLQAKGYKILLRRYKTPVGEIDLIVQKDNIIAFVEVKARATKTQALESLTPTMRRRIENAASYYIAHHDVGNSDFRFDLMILGTSSFAPFFIQHLDNAWVQGA